MMLAAGLLLALLSTAALNGGFYLQHQASQKLPELTLQHPFASLSALFTNLRWVAGFVTGLAGWALYIIALDLAPLSLVQATAAGGMGLLALLVRIGGIRLSARERVAVTTSIGGLLLVGLSLPAGTAPTTAAGWDLPLTWVLTSLLAAGIAALPAAALLRPGAGLAIASGLLYAAGDIATKAAVSGIKPVYLFAVLLPLCHGLAFVSLQLAFQRGTTLATAGISTLLNNLLPIVAGFAAFHEHMPGGLPGTLRTLGFAAAILGAALLASTRRLSKPNTPDSEQAHHPGVNASR